MLLDEFNRLDEKRVTVEFLKCCGSTKWVSKIKRFGPFTSIARIHVLADQIWKSLSDEDYLEAFAAHPKIGDNKIPEHAQNTEAMALQEQSGMSSADEQTKLELQKGNLQYFEKFGYIFIINANGKSAAEMLAQLQQRLNNDARTELKISANEQIHITHFRLEKQFI